MCKNKVNDNCYVNDKCKSNKQIKHIILFVKKDKGMKFKSQKKDNLPDMIFVEKH